MFFKLHPFGYKKNTILYKCTLSGIILYLEYKMYPIGYSEKKKKRVLKSIQHPFLFSVFQ